MYIKYYLPFRNLFMRKAVFLLLIFVSIRKCNKKKIRDARKKENLDVIV